MIQLAIDNMIIAVLCYVPQVGLNKVVKYTFYDHCQKHEC